MEAYHIGCGHLTSHVHPVGRAQVAGPVQGHRAQHTVLEGGSREPGDHLALNEGLLTCAVKETRAHVPKEDEPDNFGSEFMQGESYAVNFIRANIFDCLIILVLT